MTCLFSLAKFSAIPPRFSQKWAIAFWQFGLEEMYVHPYGVGLGEQKSFNAIQGGSNSDRAIQSGRCRDQAAPV